MLLFAYVVYLHFPDATHTSCPKQQLWSPTSSYCYLFTYFGAYYGRFVYSTVPLLLISPSNFFKSKYTPTLPVSLKTLQIKLDILSHLINLYRITF